MDDDNHTPSRRRFLTTACYVAGAGSLLQAAPLLAAEPKLATALPTVPDNKDSISLLGPKEGYTPLIGTLVSMLTWMRQTVLRSVKDMKQADLDFLLDGKANTIGALLMHLSATERFYAAHTFDGLDWEKVEKADSLKKWQVPMELGEPARKSIKGNNLDYYINALEESRAHTLAELKKRDDKWLMSTESKGFFGGPTNYFCEWFHVCEHESNHNGQIKLIRGRLPGAAGAKE
jgi:hypothetical protein